jgi:hypothetical protein
MRRFGLVLLATIAAALSDRVGYAAEGDTLITDPVLLTRLGFPSDARNVYLARGAVLNQRSTPAEPKEYGTDDFGWTTVLGNQHNPFNAPAGYSSSDGSGDISLSSPVSRIFDAQLQMPSGAVLQQVTWFGSDTVDDGAIEASIIRVCQSGIPPGDPVVTILGSGFSSTSSGPFSFTVLVSGGDVVRNLNCAYIARTRFLAVDLGGGDLVLRKIRAGWQRQVSPAPPSATFPNDVPITHSYFQFIEALARSGITAGCAPGSFCPDNPITRGEMAVFLAAALGLHSPN